MRPESVRVMDDSQPASKRPPSSLYPNPPPSLPSSSLNGWRPVSLTPIMSKRFERRLKRFGKSSCILEAFYRCAFESILTGRITTWYGNSTAYNHKAHQRVEAECGFVMMLMAIYWVTEVIPLSMTAMLPAILFPLFGIMSSSNVAKEYFNNFHFLLVGVVCLATSIEKWGLHRRVALRLVTLVGVNPAAENVPTASCRRRQGRMLCKAMCIGIAYSSSIGGITTLPGTSANLIFSEYLNHVYPDCNSINFANWFLLCLPISVIMLLLTWFWLYWLFIGSDFRQLFRENSQEIFTGVVFVVMVLLWLTRSPGFVPGWGSLFPHKSNYITDATVALVLGVLLFFVPAHGPSRKYEAMISWKEFQASMPWQVALLVGGGFALAKGAEESGLSLWVARLMTPLGDLPVLATVTIACLIVTTLTEVTSNAATITIFLPILSPLAEAIHVNPLYILIPATLCTSFSFLLPVSNPPNAVVYAYGHITILDMVKAGLGVNTIGILSLLLAMATWGIPLFSLDTYPEWAPTFNSTTP
ncbi:solute carrier family 13 member 1-like [Pundamilia nyererei]|uniref:Solute carrier family 13 member 1-like n=1 Tax=Pundamilia nyererei TaxID=303518 RepID=A0A9Y3RWB1_9CICH|nr:PREDICTED: solute carrier family 13 member 1-like [Pundamilia nyererei]